MPERDKQAEDARPLWICVQPAVQKLLHEEQRRLREVHKEHSGQQPQVHQPRTRVALHHQVAEILSRTAVRAPLRLDLPTFHSHQDRSRVQDFRQAYRDLLLDRGHVGQAQAVPAAVCAQDRRSQLQPLPRVGQAAAIRR